MPTIDLFEEAAKQKAARQGRPVPEEAPASTYEGDEERKDPSWGRTLGAAFNSETSLPVIGRSIDQNRAGNTGPRINAAQVIQANPEYKQRLANLPPEWTERARQARTEAELDFIIATGEDRLQDSITLQNAGGMRSFVSLMAVGFTDPVDLGVSVATGGASKFVTGGNALRRVAVGGTSAGLANAAVETVVSTEDPTRDRMDVGAAFGTGLVLGGMVSGVAGRRSPRLAEETRKLDKAMSQNVTTVLGRGAPPAPKAAPTAAPKAAPPAAAGSFNMGRYKARNRSAESSGNDRAAATTSSAYGRYQFTIPTWTRYYKKVFGNTGESRQAILAKRADGNVQERLMDALTEDNIKVLRANGLPVNDSTVYLMHFLGPDDGVKVLKARPDTPVSAVVRKQSIAANPAVFNRYRTAGDMMTFANRKMGGNAPATGTGNYAWTPTYEAPPQLSSEMLPDPVTVMNNSLDADPGRATREIDLIPSDPVTAGDAGAARASTDDAEYFGTEFLLPGSYGKLLGSSVPPDMRSFAAKMIAATSRKDDATRAITAEETAAHIERSSRARVYLDYNPHFKSWAEERGYGLIRQDLTSRPQQEFMREVTRAMLGDTEVSPQARKAADAFADGYERQLGQLKSSRIEGFEDVEFNRSYVPRVVNSRKFMQLRRQIGAEGVREILKAGMVAKGMPDDLATRIAKAYETGTTDRVLGRRADVPNGLAEDSIERLRYYLPGDDPELVDDVLAYLKQFRKEANKDAGRMKEAKRRIDMDLLASVRVNGTEYRAIDLFEDDANMLFERYTRSTSGWLGLAERAGIRSEAEWNAKMDELRSRNANDPNTRRRIEQLEEIKQLITGNSISSEDGTLRRGAQALMKLNFATTMGQAGMASIAELGNIVGVMGFKNALMHIPALRSFWSGARAGKVDEEFTDELRGLFGVGMRTKLSRGRAGYDDWGNDIETAAFDTIDRILDPAARAVGYAGLLGPVNDYLQLLATKAFTQKLARVALGEAKFSKADRARLRDGGFEDGVLERTLESIRQHGKFDGKRLVGLNAEKWDPQILMDFKDVTDRMVYRAVQENDIGSSAWWMHTTMGRIITQFRSFILNAYVKQTLHALRFRDAQTLTALAFTTVFGGLAWSARTYINTATDPERREKLLTEENLVRGAMASTGYSSILPTVIDTGLMQAGFDPLFSHVRTTGLSTGFVQGNPTLATVNSAVDAVTMPARLVHEDYEFSREDMTDLTKLLPANNVTGVRNLIDLLEADLPKRSRSEDDDEQ